MARARLLSVVALLLSGAIGVISSTQTWLSVALVEAAHGTLEVPGASALPVLAPLSLATLALGAALSIVGRAWRYVLGVIGLAISVPAGWATSVIALTLPPAAASAVITESTGISGVDATTQMVASVSSTVWPMVTVIAWLLAVAGGLLILVSAHRWSDGGRRYRSDVRGSKASESDGPVDAIDSWDDLSRGSDPTT